MINFWLKKKELRMLAEEFRFPQFEKDIINDIKSGKLTEKDVTEELIVICYNYAKNIIKSRFYEGEKFILTSAFHSFNYACNVVQGPFREAERIIASDSSCAYNYAYNVLKGRFLDGEPTIYQSFGSTLNYVIAVLKAPCPLFEQLALSNLQNCIWYSYSFIDYLKIRGPWPEIEATIATDAGLSYNYAVSILKGRFLAGEDQIKKDLFYRELYAQLLESNKWNVYT